MHDIYFQVELSLLQRGFVFSQPILTDGNSPTYSSKASSVHNCEKWRFPLLIFLVNILFKQNRMPLVVGCSKVIELQQGAFAKFNTLLKLIEIYSPGEENARGSKWKTPEKSLGDISTNSWLC